MTALCLCRPLSRSNSTSTRNTNTNNTRINSTNNISTLQILMLSTAVVAVLVVGVVAGHVGDVALRSVITPSGQPSVSHSNVHLPCGDVASAQSALKFFFH
jgi:hypothetical protein